EFLHVQSGNRFHADLRPGTRSRSLEKRRPVLLDLHRDGGVGSDDAGPLGGARRGLPQLALNLQAQRLGTAEPTRTATFRAGAAQEALDPLAYPLAGDL